MTIAHYIELGLMLSWVYMSVANYLTLRKILKIIKRLGGNDEEEDSIPASWIRRYSK